MIFQTLNLYSAHLKKQAQFYAEVLGLEVHQTSEASFQCRIGHTLLHFQADPKAKPYHFAINIPANQEQEALAWLKARVDIINYEGVEIQDFSNWNAKAIYFYDADQNMVEFIARKNLPNHSSDAFGPHALLEISEIGLPTADIEGLYRQLHERLGLRIYDGNFERFCAIGGERALFICIDPTKKDWFPSHDKAWPVDFAATMAETQNHYQLNYRKGELRIE